MNTTLAQITHLTHQMTTPPALAQLFATQRDATMLMLILRPCQVSGDGVPVPNHLLTLSKDSST